MKAETAKPKLSTRHKKNQMILKLHMPCETDANVEKRSEDKQHLTALCNPVFRKHVISLRPSKCVGITVMIYSTVS